MDNELETREAVSENTVTAQENAVSNNDEKGNVSENVIPNEENTVSNDENEAKPEKKSETQESLESKLRRFKRQSSGIVAEVRKREAYDKPCKA